MHSIDRRQIKIYIGGHNITTDYVDTRRVARIFEHEYFDTVSFDFDIAILELSKPIEFGPKIQPACLPETVFQDYSGKTGLIAGWGRLGMFTLCSFFHYCEFPTFFENIEQTRRTIKYKSIFNLEFVPKTKFIEQTILFFFSAFFSISVKVNRRRYQAFCVRWPFQFGRQKSVTILIMGKSV